MSSSLYNYYLVWPAVHGPTHMREKLENVTIIVDVAETKFIVALYEIPQKWNSAGKAERTDGYPVAQFLPPLEMLHHCSCSDHLIPNCTPASVWIRQIPLFHTVL